MWIRTANHHFSLDNELHIYFVDTGRIILQGEEAKQVLDYLDNISCPAWGLEVPEVTKEYKE